MIKGYRSAIIILIVIVILGVEVAINMMSQKKEEQAITIGFAGDVMIGRLVNEIIDQTGYQYPWGNMLPYLHKTDLNIINLETTLTHSTKKVPKVFNFKASPDRVQILKEANIDIVDLANNHSLDFEVEGLHETIAVLDAAGITHVGAGATIAAAKKPVIIEKKGIRIGIIGCTDNEPEWKATENKPGTNYVNINDAQSVDELCKNIKELRPQVDIVVLTIHWGPNMRKHPSAEFVAAAHKLIECGVDIFHGHSAHILQGIELYKNALIMYDTGDFVDDYMVTPSKRNDHSALFLVTIDKNGIQGVTRLHGLKTVASHLNNRIYFY